MCFRVFSMYCYWDMNIVVFRNKLSFLLNLSMFTYDWHIICVRCLGYVHICLLVHIENKRKDIKVHSLSGVSKGPSRGC